MVIRLFSIAFLSSALLSCSMTMDGANTYKMVMDDERTSNMQMADHRGLNADMMNYRLGALLAEAQKIDHDMDMLLARMNALHVDIKKHKLQADATNAAESVAMETPQVLIAIKEGQNSVTATAPDMHSHMTQTPEVKKVEIKPSPKTSTNTALYAKDGVVNIRHGVHKGKTRLVFDINGSTSHNVDFDKDVGLVTIAMPETGWNTDNSKTYTLQQLSGYEAKPQGQGGSVVALAVKNTSDVKTSTMKKSGIKPARLVIDLMR